MASYEEHFMDVCNWVDDLAREHRDHLHVEKIIISELTRKLCHTLVAMDEVLKELE